jgi:ethanolamine permease
VAGNNAWTYDLLISIGICGLLASFNGLILASGRSSLELGRAKFAPAFLGKISERFKTPMNALLFNLGLGILALLTGRTSDIITISVFGALSLYILSMIALLRLRIKEPALARPFKVPLYPFFPILALTIASISIIAMIYYNVQLALCYFALLLLCYLIYKAYSFFNKTEKSLS